MPSSSREEQKETTKDLYRFPLPFLFVCNIVGCLRGALLSAPNRALHRSLHATVVAVEHYACYLIFDNYNKA